MAPLGPRRIPAFAARSDSRGDPDVDENDVRRKSKAGTLEANRLDAARRGSLDPLRDALGQDPHSLALELLHHQARHIRIERWKKRWRSLDHGHFEAPRREAFGQLETHVASAQDDGAPAPKEERTGWLPRPRAGSR